MSKPTTPPTEQLISNNTSSPDNETINNAASTPDNQITKSQERIDAEVATKLEYLQVLSKQHCNMPDSERSWSNICQNNLCIGEEHIDLTPKKFLIDNMPFFATQGYNVLFLEHVGQEYQNLLDDFFETTTGTMDPELEQFLRKLNDGHMESCFRTEEYRTLKESYNFLDLVVKAKEAGIKTIALEESEEIWRKSTSNTQQGSIRRTVSLNHNVQKVINDTEIDFLKNDKKLKWLSLVGSSHLYNFLEVPGICEILPNVQDILIHDSSFEKELISMINNEAITTMTGVKASIMLVRELSNDLSFSTIEQELSTLNGPSNPFSRLPKISALPPEISDIKRPKRRTPSPETEQTKSTKMLKTTTQDLQNNVS